MTSFLPGVSMNLLLATAAVAIVGTAFFGDQTQSDRPQKETIRVMPVAKTPEPATTILALAMPKNEQVLNGNPVWIQFRIDGYSLGSNSQFDRASEVVNSNMGQTVHILIDNQPYFPVNEPAIDPFNEDGWYYDMSYKFALPFNLKDGMHTIRMFPARSFGESLKNDRTFVAMNFYLGDQTNRPGMDLNKPYLTYNEPSDEFDLVEDMPVLLDFWISNCELTSDGYKVRLTVDGRSNRLLTSWQPYYIYGLKKGKHTVRLELVDSKNQLVPGLFNNVERTIVVH